METLRPSPTALLRDIKTGEVQRQFVGHEDGVSATAFSPDGTKVLTGSWDNGERLWDKESGRLLQQFVGHSDYVGAVAFHPTKPWIATGSWDGVVRLWDLRMAGEVCDRDLCRLIAFPDQAWAVVDPDGRYQTSGGPRLEHLHWVIDNEPVDLEQLDLQYWDSHLLSKLFRGDQLNNVASLARPGLYPHVEIKEPMADSRWLKIVLTNRGGGIGQVRVTVDGKVVAEREVDDPLAARQELSLSLTSSDLAPTLIPGRQNQIEATAENYRQSTACGAGTSAWSSRGGPARRPIRIWAVIVGTSAYNGEALRLRYAAKDAQDFRAGSESRSSWVMA